MVPVDVAEVLLVLLTDRVSGGILFTPRFGLVTAGLLIGLGACVLPALRPNMLAFSRVDFDLPTTTLTLFRVGAAAVDWAGTANFGGIEGLNGEVGRERLAFSGESYVICVGGWRRVRELDDLGESTVDGFGA